MPSPPLGGSVVLAPSTPSCWCGVRYGHGKLLVKVVPIPSNESNPRFNRKSHGSDETMAVKFRASFKD